MKFEKTTFWGMIAAAAVVAAASAVFITNTVKHEENEVIVSADDISQKMAGEEEQGAPAEGISVEETGGISAATKKAVKELVFQYKDYGLTAEFIKDDYQLYYNGEPVCWFADNQNGANAEEFKGAFFLRPASEQNGYGAVVTKRDENGKLEGLVYLSKEEAEAYRNGMR